MGSTSLITIILAILHLSYAKLTLYENADSGSTNTTYPKLIQLITIARNGARSPKNYIPTIPCSNFSHLDQLTELGQSQQFTLGQEIRQEYSSFLPTSYDPDEIYFRAADNDTMLQSAASFAQGLFSNTSATSVRTNDLSNYSAPVRLSVFEFHSLPLPSDISDSCSGI